MFPFPKKEKKESSILDMIVQYKPMMESLLGVKIDNIIQDFAASISTKQNEIEARLGLLLTANGGTIVANLYVIRDMSMDLVSSCNIEKIEDLSKLVESFKHKDFSQFKTPMPQDGNIAIEAATSAEPASDTAANTDTTATA